MDFFPAGIPGRPTMFYIHGGYWQWIDKEEESFVAWGPLAQGINVALCEYRLCPTVTLDQVVADVALAFDWIAPRLAQYDADPERLFVAGSSAGAHLAATLLGRHEVAGALLVSGIYDLEPLLHTRFNDALGLDMAAARRNSPLVNIPRSHATVCFAVGANELPDMIRQTETYYRAWINRGFYGWQEAVAGADHFTVMDHLVAADGILTHALLRMCAGTTTQNEVAHSS
jgi:acetyl esterase/lipase